VDLAVFSQTSYPVYAARRAQEKTGEKKPNQRNNKNPAQKLNFHYDLTLVLED